MILFEDEIITITKETDCLRAIHKEQKGKLTKPQFTQLLSKLTEYAKTVYGDYEFSNKGENGKYELIAKKQVLVTIDSLTARFCPLIKDICKGKICIFYKEIESKSDNVIQKTVTCLSLENQGKSQENILGI